jgi:glycosyltransferase involved in cell wall biosynthesis
MRGLIVDPEFLCVHRTEEYTGDGPTAFVLTPGFMNVCARRRQQTEGCTGSGMSTVPLISVIIPAYNAERFLRATLASVQAQSYRNVEIVVVDDGSTDATAKIAEEAAQADHRICIIHQPNLGVAAARNQGLAEAKGEFIAPLDADDVWHPLNLALQVEALNKANPDVAVSYAWFLTIDAHGNF